MGLSKRDPNPTIIVRARSTLTQIVACFFGITGHVSIVSLEQRRMVNSQYYTTICFPELFKKSGKPIAEVESFITHQLKQASFYAFKISIWWGIPRTILISNPLLPQIRNKLLLEVHTWIGVGKKWFKCKHKYVCILIFMKKIWKPIEPIPIINIFLICLSQNTNLHPSYEGLTV